MKVKQVITSKKTYTDIKVASENEGVSVLHAKRSDNGSKVIIYALRIDSEPIKKSYLSNNKKTWSIPEHQFIQKSVQKGFLSAIDSNQPENLYYLMPVKHLKTTLQATLESYNHLEKLEIAYKIAKGVQYLHNEVNIYHGNLQLASIFIKKDDEEKGYEPKLTYPFPAKILKHSLSRKKLSVYRIPHEELAKSSDIWSLGIIFYELLTGKELPDKDKLKDHPQIFDHDEFGLNIKNIKSTNIEKLVKSMLSRDASGRILIDDVVHTLKTEVLKSLYGEEYLIPLIQQEKECQRDNKLEIAIPRIVNKVEQQRIILKQLVLVIRLIQGIKMSLSLHYRQNFETFLSIEYCFTELPQAIKKKFNSLQRLYQELSKKDKKTIRFNSNGALVFYQQQAL